MLQHPRGLEGKVVQTLAGRCAHAQVGDKIEAVSASFGTDVWEAKNFGQVMYAIKTRNGEVYIKFRRMYGDTSALMVRWPPLQLLTRGAEAPMQGRETDVTLHVSRFNHLDHTSFHPKKSNGSFTYHSEKQCIRGTHWGMCTLAQEEDMSTQEKQFKTERRGGNYGMGTKEMQAANYRARKTAEARRRELFDQALSKFKKNDIEGVRARSLPAGEGVSDE